MARIRDPARDKAKELYLNNKDITNREIANILKIDEKKVATWKYRDKWECNTEEKKNVVQQNKKCSTTKPKEEKKALISSEDKDYEWVDEEDGLTDKQRLFCHYYMQSLNAFQAAIKAEYSPSYARVDVYRLLENPSIKKYLEKLKEQQRQKFLISQERILNRHIQVALSDINEYFNEDGSPKPITHTDGTLIKKMKIVENDKGKSVEIELIEKCKSLDFLTRYLGLESEDKDNKIITSINEVRKKNGL
ncbi:MAG: terminase small subunit [Fusobacterium varium]|uniref:terminase small subunit n=1 Tax=Fusobacterium varium TaxID=856 RepID=UPI00189893D0|nr:terminase small subunit [Fusobacterium varium]MCF0171643.1 terminase small subunit [Fusobacterium varium]MCI6032313.1 terminase small subunit [Fusobacterium varium]MDY4004519.1 terminase small subunit [Fusobacterium varium]DAK06623.1 MAG TPA: Terminase small subunit [Caudoviricetes sp.]